MTVFPRRGEIWFVEFPDDPKSRPALIVSIDVRNEFSNSVLAVPITTNLRPSPTHVPLPAKQGGLTHDSMARCENVSYLHKSRLSRGPLGGAISPALMVDVESCLHRSLGVIAYVLGESPIACWVEQIGNRSLHRTPRFGKSNASIDDPAFFPGKADVLARFDQAMEPRPPGSRSSAMRTWPSQPPNGCRPSPRRLETSRFSSRRIRSCTSASSR